APAALVPFVGEYGPDDSVIYVLEREGRLWLQVGSGHARRLVPVGGDAFSSRAPSGMTSRTVFARDASGHVTGVSIDGVAYQGRRIGPEEGQPQLRITPVRPVDELLREARSATPPAESGDRLRPDLVELTALDPSIKLDIRYATTNNFLGTVFY